MPAAKAAAKKPAKRAPARENAQTKSARRQMHAVLLFASGILLGTLTFIEGESLWATLHRFLFGMLGLSAYLLAPLLLYIAVAAAMDKPFSSPKTKLWQVGLVVALLSAAFQIFGAGLPDGKKLVETVAGLYRQGAAPSGGGLAGGAFAWPLLTLFGKLGASIIVVLLLFVLVMLLTGSTLLGLLRAAKKPVEGLEETFAERARERQEKGAVPAAAEPPAKRRGRASAGAAPETAASAASPGHFAYDVDISGDTVVAPEPDMTAALANAAAQAAKGRLLGLAGAPPDSPVEVISSQELRGGGVFLDVSDAAAQHPLDVDILRAEQGGGEIADHFLPPPVEVDPPWAPVAPRTQPLYDNDTPPAPDAPARQAAQTAQQQPVCPTATPPAPPPAPRYVFPAANLLRQGRGPSNTDVSAELNANAQTLVDTLKSFGVQTRITDICRGPAVTRYELQPSAGVKISRITGLADDIALNLASAGIRIEAPIPNKAAVGIEVPNKNISMVTIREIIESQEFMADKGVLTIALGRDIAGNTTLSDIGRMPHVLIAGATGSGKSVCINSIIMSLLFKYSPDEVKLLMVDPKVVELGVYNGIPHLLVPVVTDPKKAAGALSWAVARMLERYQTFAQNGVKDLAGFNRLAETRDDLSPMPKIVIIIDELADLMMAAPNEVEDSICRLAQMARAAGMHLVIATQRPSVDVITGVIKANIPSRIAFAVSSQVDSRTILDMGGAEKLLGRGDMLFYPVGIAKPMRVQGCFVTENEVESVVTFIKESAATNYDDGIMEDIDRLAVVGKGKGKAVSAAEELDEGEDEMLPQAIECVVEAGMASTSLLQRRLKLGYARAARIIDQLEQKGVVGPFEGSKPRQVLISKDRWLEMRLSGAEDALLAQTRLRERAAGGPAEAPPFDVALPPDDPVIPPEKGGVKARPDEFEFAHLR